jgi:hypothetical protein
MAKGEKVMFMFILEILSGEGANQGSFWKVLKKPCKRSCSPKKQTPILALSNLTASIGGIATLPNGWTDNKLGLKWFKQTFIPFATAHKVNNRAHVAYVVIVVGRAHVQFSWMYWKKQHGPILSSKSICLYGPAR